MRRRTGNNPKRRIASPDRLALDARTSLAETLQYVGSSHHKRHPADYGFHPPVNPRPWKSICDSVRSISLKEAQHLFHMGVRMGMFSDFSNGHVPKYVWSVDSQGDAYEAKIGQDGYHGYRLEEDDNMRSLVLKEWSRRAGR